MTTTNDLLIENTIQSLWLQLNSQSTNHSLILVVSSVLFIVQVGLVLLSAFYNLGLVQNSVLGFSEGALHARSSLRSSGRKLEAPPTAIVQLFTIHRFDSDRRGVSSKWLSKIKAKSRKTKANQIKSE